jgi:hypothetical protein
MAPLIKQRKKYKKINVINIKMFVVEDGIDFYSEINQSEAEKNDCCLITNDPLEDDHVRLTCNHSFNYRPLYTHVFNQKINVNFSISYLKVCLTPSIIFLIKPFFFSSISKELA